MAARRDAEEGNRLLQDEDSHSHDSRIHEFEIREDSPETITSEQALIHFLKVMLGTGMLSLPLAFKYSGLVMGLILLTIICLICLYCTRQLVLAARYVCHRTGRSRIDYANVMRKAVELGPSWIQHKGYLAKQTVNSTMFFTQLGFCCVYFVFMADNLKQFFDETSNIHLSQSTWIALLLLPTMSLCTVRKLKSLAPIALIANFVYFTAVTIVLGYLFTDPKPFSSLPAFPRDWSKIPLFFGTVIFAFEGVAVVLPIENQMKNPSHFISSCGVLNVGCYLVLDLYCVIGFFGYLKIGDDVKDTVTLNLPNTTFYQFIKVMFVSCILVSYPLQFYVPMERVEKWISRKIQKEKQEQFVYLARFGFVILTCLLAELIPHLALFISLIGAFASTALALIFPPIIEILCDYSRGCLTFRSWIKNIILLLFAMLGIITGTYTSLEGIFNEMGKPDV